MDDVDVVVDETDEVEVDELVDEVVVVVVDETELVDVVETVEVELDVVE